MRGSRWTAFGLAVAVAVVAAACSGGSTRPRPAPTTKPTPATPAYPLDSTLRLNQIQVLGSHNSYHGEPYPQVLAELRKVNAATAAGLDYGHRPLAQQFDLGVRQIELDV